VLNYYKHLGKVRNVDGADEIEDVYKQVQQAIKPQVVFFYGPPCVGKTSVARLVCAELQYFYLSLEDFGKAHKCRT